MGNFQHRFHAMAMRLIFPWPCPSLGGWTGGTRIRGTGSGGRGLLGSMFPWGSGALPVLSSAHNIVFENWIDFALDSQYFSTKYTSCTCILNLINKTFKP